MTIPLKSLRPDFSIPALGQGTWRMGGATERDPANDDAADIAAICRALEAGVTHIDTAEMYAGGHAEELVGQAIAGYDRAKLFLTSKVWKTHLRYDDVLRAAEGSLRRLGTDYLDLYLIHQVDPEVPEAETIRALNRLRSEGVIRAMGVSNFSQERLERAMAAAEYPVAVNQLHYNLQVREIEKNGLLEFCRRHGVMVIAWRPLRDVDPAVPVVMELAAKYGRPPGQVVLNFLLSQPGVVTICKASNPVHLAENVGAADWTLAPEDVERLRSEYPHQVTTSPAVPLI